MDIDINKIVDDIVEATDGLVTEGVASQEIPGGEYELHLKQYHLGVAKGMNIFSASELSLYMYKYMTPEKLASMMTLNEFPLNIRTLYRDNGGLHLLNDTRVYTNVLPEVEDIEDIIEYDWELIKNIKGGN